MTEALSKLERLRDLLKAKEGEAIEPDVDAGEVIEEPQATEPEATPPPPMSNLDYALAYADEPETLTAEEKNRIEKAGFIYMRDKALMAAKKGGSSWGW